jgi:hypothetical protein
MRYDVSTLPPTRQQRLYSDEEITAFVRTCNAHQAPMTFNVGIYQDGTMAEASAEQLRRLGMALAARPASG